MQVRAEALTTALKDPKKAAILLPHLVRVAAATGTLLEPATSELVEAINHKRLVNLATPSSLLDAARRAAADLANELDDLDG
jgi:hypothetical protein